MCIFSGASQEGARLSVTLLRTVQQPGAPVTHLSADINYVGLPWSHLGVRHWSGLPLPASGGNETSQLLKEQTPQESAPPPAASLSQESKTAAGPPGEAAQGRSSVLTTTRAGSPFLLLQLLRGDYGHTPGFLSPGTMNIWGLMILCCRDGGTILPIPGYLTASLAPRTSCQ